VTVEGHLDLRMCDMKKMTLRREGDAILESILSLALSDESVSRLEV
jgi:hypothetical protein